MAWTQGQLDALKAAYASGVQQVKHGDNAITYASLAEMKKAIDTIEARLSGRSRVNYPEFTRE
jgi:hypothetical protein